MFSVWTDSADISEHRIDSEFYDPIYVAHDRSIRVNVEKHVPLAKVGSISKLKTGPFGSKLPSSLYRDSGIPLFRSQNITPFFPDENNLVFLDAQTHYELQSSEVLPDTLLVSKAGRVGDTCILSSRFEKSNITEHVIGLIPSVEIDPYFLVTSFNCPIVKKQAERFGLGTILNYLGVEATRNIKVPIPSTEIQQAIGNKVRKAERLREKARALQTLVTAAIANFYSLKSGSELNFGNWVSQSDISTKRLDSWFHKSFYLDLHNQLRTKKDLVQVRKLCKLVTVVAQLSSWSEETFDYFEIGGIDSETGQAAATTVKCSDAPSRAKYLVKSGDVLVSTVRPNLRSIAMVPNGQKNAVCSSGFAVLRCDDLNVAAYVRACLIQDAAAHQMMRWNTGATYPAIDRSVPLQVFIPNPGEEEIRALGSQSSKSSNYLTLAKGLVEAAKSDVEALIDGTLDEDRLLSEGEEIERWLESHPSQGQRN